MKSNKRHKLQLVIPCRAVGINIYNVQIISDTFSNNTPSKVTSKQRWQGEVVKFTVIKESQTSSVSVRVECEADTL